VREDKRARRIRWVTAAYAALALGLTLYVFVRRVRDADAAIERHLQRAGAEEALSIAPRRGARTLLAAACIGLGFLVLALLALFKE
jgi:predicted lysophospholipase L1 biosynthesis ABC-type transport system permease subunit